MATRFYFPSAGTAPASPAISGDWTVNTASPVRLPLLKNRSGTGMVNLGSISEGTGTAIKNVFFRQFISEPLNAQTITGSVSGMFRANENNAAANANGQLVIKVVSNDGSVVRGTLLGVSTATTVTNEFTTTFSHRAFPGSSGTLNPVVVQDGDRLVIEIGTRNHNTSSTAYTTAIIIGDNSSTDQSGIGATSTNNPWVEFTDDIEMYGEGKYDQPAPDGAFVLDNFNAADGTAITSHTGELGASWTLHPSAATTPIIANKAIHGSGLNSTAYASGVPASPNYEVTAYAHQQSDIGYAGLLARLSTTALTWYHFRYSAGDDAWEIGKSVNGTQTVLASYTMASPAGTSRRVRFVVTDAVKEAYLNDILVASTTDNTITDAGRVGFREHAAASGPSEGGQFEWIAAADYVAFPVAGDTGNVTGSDTAAITGRASTVADNGPISGSETAAITGRASTVADNGSISGSDTAAITGRASTVADNGALTGSDTASKVDFTAKVAADSGSLTGTDSVSGIRASTVADSGSISGSETASKVDFTAKVAADSGSLTGVDATSLARSSSVNDSGTLSGEDSVSGERLAAVADADAIAGSDSASVADQTAKTAADSGSLTGTESASGNVSVATSDSSTIGSSDGVSGSSLLTAFDTATIAGTDSTSVTDQTAKAAADSATLTGVDAASGASLLDAVDTATVGATEEVFVADDTSLYAVDSATLTGTDVASGTWVGSISDTDSISGIDSASLSGETARSVTDSATLTGTDNATTGATAQAADTATIAGADSADVQDVTTMTAADVATLDAEDAITSIHRSSITSDTSLLAGTDAASAAASTTASDTSTISGEDTASIAAIDDVTFGSSAASAVAGGASSTLRGQLVATASTGSATAPQTTSAMGLSTEFIATPASATVSGTAAEFAGQDIGQWDASSPVPALAGTSTSLLATTLDLSAGIGAAQMSGLNADITGRSPTYWPVPGEFLFAKVGDSPAIVFGPPRVPSATTVRSGFGPAIAVSRQIPPSWLTLRVWDPPATTIARSVALDATVGRAFEVVTSLDRVPSSSGVVTLVEDEPDTVAMVPGPRATMSAAPVIGNTANNDFPGVIATFDRVPDAPAIMISEVRHVDY